MNNAIDNFSTKVVVLCFMFFYASTDTNMPSQSSKYCACAMIRSGPPTIFECTVACFVVQWSTNVGSDWVIIANLQEHRICRVSYDNISQS